jgi:hypothetical protein
MNGPSSASLLRHPPYSGRHGARPNTLPNVVAETDGVPDRITQSAVRRWFRNQNAQGNGAFNPQVESYFLNEAPDAGMSWTTAFSKGCHPIEPWLVLSAIVTLDARGGATHQRARVMRKSAEGSRKEAGMWCLSGWGAVIDQLAAYGVRMPRSHRRLGGPTQRARHADVRSSAPHRIWFGSGSGPRQALQNQRNHLPRLLLRCA